MLKDTWPERDRFGWPVIRVVCAYCGIEVKSNALYGVKVDNDVIKKCCLYVSCIEKFKLEVDRGL